MNVSVVVAVYDGAPVIARAIDSVLAQTAPADEIIVVDDASGDGTRDIVRAYSRRHPEIRLIALDTNGGPSRARNAGIAAARGDWIAILDADDAWKPQRLARLTAIAQQHGADFVADNLVLYDATAAREGRLGFEVPWEVKDIGAEDLFRNGLNERVAFDYGLLKPLIRRRFVVEAGLAYDESHRYGEDFMFYAELLLSGAKAVLTREAYYVYSTRIGEFSGEPSPLSRSSPRFDRIIEASDTLAVKYADRITGAVARAITRRRAVLRLIHLANVAREFRHAGAYAKHAGLLLKNPALVLFLVDRQLRRRWSRRR